jgi:hypothetical protein
MTVAKNKVFVMFGFNFLLDINQPLSSPRKVMSSSPEINLFLLTDIVLTTPISGPSKKPFENGLVNTFSCVCIPYHPDLFRPMSN